MAVIELTTVIKAPASICFDLARSIDLHKASFSSSGEEAIEGVTSGLIGLHEEVTWQATHLGWRQRLSSRITAFQYPYHFRDEMTKGIFRKLKHDHFFSEENGVTIMRDVFEFESPFGLLGKIMNRLILINYLRSLLATRNNVIRGMAESNEWKYFINH